MKSREVIPSFCFRPSHPGSAEVQRTSESSAYKDGGDDRALLHLAGNPATHVSVVPRVRDGDRDDLQFGEDLRESGGPRAAIGEGGGRGAIRVPRQQYGRFRDGRIGSLHYKQPLHPPGPSTG